MTNKELAKCFQKLGQIMELHGENPFKIRSYSNAYLTLRKFPDPLVDMKVEDIRNIKGIGNAISEKIQELLETGKMKTYEAYRERTPEGIVDLLGLKGFGPKKIKLVWKELGVESAGELLYACRENRLVDVKGFGAKTQEELKSQLEYFMRSSGKFLYAHAEYYALQLLSELKMHYPHEKFDLTGEILRNMPVISQIEIDTTMSPDVDNWMKRVELKGLEKVEGVWRLQQILISIKPSDRANYILHHIKNSSSSEFYKKLNENLLDKFQYESESKVFNSILAPFVPPELRDDPLVLKNNQEWFDSIILEDQIKGVIHTHSQYSDGMNTIREMADCAKSLGYEYIVVSDHSKSAFYANGLQEDRLRLQWEEIDTLNQEYKDFKIFKGIESDILYNGDLDYDDSILAEFDLIIASVHSNLKMNEDKANQRLISAIENPYTRILGHPTGRLLLSRLGYPINHRKIIEACAANNVVLELNASPYRLDLDWTWIDFALNRGVMISINPDAHSIAGINDIHYGVKVARKAALPVQMCLNAKPLHQFNGWLSQ